MIVEESELDNQKTIPDPSHGRLLSLDVMRGLAIANANGAIIGIVTECRFEEIECVKQSG